MKCCSYCTPDHELLLHAQRSTEKEKEQSEYASNKVFCNAVLLLGIADFCLMFVVNNHRLLTS